jgi:hypothetical protein
MSLVQLRIAEPRSAEPSRAPDSAEPSRAERYDRAEPQAKFESQADAGDEQSRPNQPTSRANRRGRGGARGACERSGGAAGGEAVGGHGGEGAGAGTRGRAKRSRGRGAGGQTEEGEGEEQAMGRGEEGGMGEPGREEDTEGEWMGGMEKWAEARTRIHLPHLGETRRAWPHARRSPGPLLLHSDPRGQLQFQDHERFRWVSEARSA